MVDGCGAALARDVALTSYRVDGQDGPSINIMWWRPSAGEAVAALDAS